MTFVSDEYRAEVEELMKDQHIIWLANTISMFQPMRDIVLKWSINDIPFEFIVQCSQQYYKMCNALKTANHAATFGGPAKAVIRLVQLSAIKSKPNFEQYKGTYGHRNESTTDES